MYIVFRKWKEMRKLGLPFMSPLVAFIMSAILLSCLHSLLLSVYDTIRYDTRCYFNVHSKAVISQLNLPHGIWYML